MFFLHTGYDSSYNWPYHMACAPEGSSICVCTVLASTFIFVRMLTPLQVLSWSL